MREGRDLIYILENLFVFREGRREGIILRMRRFLESYINLER